MACRVEPCAFYLHHLPQAKWIWNTAGWLHLSHRSACFKCEKCHSSKTQPYFPSSFFFPTTLLSRSPLLPHSLATGDSKHWCKVDQEIAEVLSLQRNKMHSHKRKLLRCGTFYLQTEGKQHFSDFFIYFSDLLCDSNFYIPPSSFCIQLF